jgi:cytochrome oxidase Cu insertion factor (SCO1/SenC/PrrC family)
MRITRWRQFVTALALAGTCLLDTGSATAMNVGDKAPDFALPATMGKQARLADLLGNKVVVLFFYHAAFTNT